MKPISVLIADDHTLMRETLANWLSANPGFVVVASVPSADEAVAQALRLKPDIVLLDIDMPGLNSFEAARTIRSQSANTRIVFLSAFTNDRYIDLALRVEASGYITKRESPDAVVNAIQNVAAGVAYYSPEVRERIVISPRGARLAAQPKSRAATLSQRELDMLRYVARGLSKKEIAQIAHLSDKTVGRHIANIMNKLNLHDRVDLARFAIREGLAEP